MDLHEIKKTISRPELLQIAETVARDKSIEQEIVIKSMEQAIQSVAKLVFASSKFLFPKPVFFS